MLIPLITELSGWINFVVKGSVAALHKHPQATLVSVPESRQVPLPTYEESLQRYNYAMTMEKNPVIARLVDTVSPDRLRSTIEFLSSTFFTRLSTSETGNPRPFQTRLAEMTYILLAVWQAQQWIEAQYKALGNFQLQEMKFQERFI